MKRIILFLFLFCFISSAVTFATVRDLEGVDIISRSERGAQENWKWTYGGQYGRYLQDAANYEAWLQGNLVDHSGKYAQKKQDKEQDAKRRSYLINTYPYEIASDKVLEYEGKQVLRWPQEFVYQKTKIIIHHTAGNENYETPAEAMSGVRDIYKYHTVTKGRGDIGYNFLIDEFGNIYEGRAGGAGVVGAHASWNNMTTIGIALMGNFEHKKPSPEMWHSLVKLSTALAWKYDINPEKMRNYFTASDVYPYLDVHEHKSIVGHQDTKNTACPGHYVQSRMSLLRAQVGGLLSYFKTLGTIDRRHIHFLREDEPFYLQQDQGNVEVDIDHGGILHCFSLDTHIEVNHCERSANGNITLVIKRNDNSGISGRKSFFIKIGGEYYIVDVMVVREDDIASILRKRRESAGFSASDAFSPGVEETKITEKISTDRAKALLEGDISVLLYEITSRYDMWSMQCDTGCDVVLDDQTIKDAKIINLIKNEGGNALGVYIDLKKFSSSRVEIKNDDGIVAFNHHETDAGTYEIGQYHGNIRIEKARYKHLDHGWMDDYTVVNTLPVEQYLLGMGETSELQHIEKLKTMALLIKGYIFFYLGGQNYHRSIPAGAAYQAIDDPRIFQKYIGATGEEKRKKRQEALNITKNEVISYNNFLPILPYFHCSAGFTKSGKENFGRKDTPWLRSKLDFARCESGGFAGHGVGLSGDGAESLAQQGVKYHEIIKWYYEGVEIEKMSN